jgi:hypothetical protein
MRTLGDESRHRCREQPQRYSSFGESRGRRIATPDAAANWWRRFRAETRRWAVQDIEK